MSYDYTKLFPYKEIRKEQKEAIDFGLKAFKSTHINYNRIVKSQTLSTKKIRKLLRIKKNEFHLDTKNQLLKCRKFFF